MADTIERNAEKQNRYREANERIAQVLSKFATSGWFDKPSGVFEFFCECGQPGRCGEHVKVSAATYERVRSDPTTFILFPGHEATAVENTIERSEGFLISRNFGRAAEIARAADPRRIVKVALGTTPKRLSL
jgi:hypothetical protein